MGIIIRQSILSSLYTYIGTLIGAISILFAFPLFLSPEEFGAFRLIVELGALLSSFGLLGIGQSIIRFYPYFREEKTSNGFLFLVLIFSFFGSVVMGGAYYFFRDEIFTWFANDRKYISDIYLPIFLVGLFRIYQTVFENIAANHGKITSNNFFREILTRIHLLLVVFLYYREWLDFAEMCLAVSAVFAINAVLNFLLVVRSLRLDFKPNWSFLQKNPVLRKDMLRFNLWLILSSVSLLIVQKIDFFMLGGTKGMLDTAVYSIGFYLAVLVEIPKRSLQQVSGPIVSQHLKENNLGALELLYKQSANNGLFGGVGVFLMILSITPLFFYYMPKGEIYLQSLGVVYMVGLAKIFESWGVTAFTILSNSKFYFYGLINAVLNIFLAIYLNFLLIPTYGINGAAFATLITITVSILTSVLVVYVKFRLSPITAKQAISLSYLGLGLCVIWMSAHIKFVWFQSLIPLFFVGLMGYASIVWLKVSPELKSLEEKAMGFIKSILIVKR